MAFYGTTKHSKQDPHLPEDQKNISTMGEEVYQNLKKYLLKEKRNARKEDSGGEGVYPMRNQGKPNGYFRKNNEIE